MFSKRYMYDIGQETCIRLIEDGYVQTFEEIHNLMNTYKRVKDEAERSTSKTTPKDFKKDPEIFHHLEENLRKAEDAERKGSFEDNCKFRMDLGKYFHELEGYQWLASHFYESSKRYGFKMSIDVKLAVKSLQQQAYIQEKKGNADISLKYLKKAQKLALKNSLSQDDPLLKNLNGDLCRIYLQLGSKHLELESDTTAADKSQSLKYATKAVQQAAKSDDLEIRAACYALQGKVMMKFKEDELALKSFQLYTELSERNNDKYGMCQGFFAISEIFKRTGDLEKSTEALNKCQKLAQSHCFDIPLVFSILSLGQIETAKRNYTQAIEHFEEAYDKIMTSTVDYPKKEALKNLTKVMCGIGNAHITFHHLINHLQMPMDLMLPELLRWRRKGGPFINVEEEQTINLDDAEKDDQEAELSTVIEKLINLEYKMHHKKKKGNKNKIVVNV